MVADESAAVPAALMSMGSFCEMAWRNRVRSSERLISQGLLRRARDGSISMLRGGFESREESATVSHLCRTVVDDPRDTPGGVDSVGDVALGDENVPQRDGDYLGFRGALLEEAREAVGVDGVQSGVNLIEQVEGM